MITTRATHSLSCVKSCPQQPLHVANRRLRTQLASVKAVRIVAWIQRGVGLNLEPDEGVLFAALHTCAYHVARREERIRTIKAERTRWIERWKVIRDYLVEKNLGLAYSMVRQFRFSPLNLYRDDLLSDALYALTRAVDRFDPWRGYRFSTYACNIIARALAEQRRQEQRRRQQFVTLFDVYGVAFEQAGPQPDPYVALYAERLERILDRNLADLSDLELRIVRQRFLTRRRASCTLQRIADAIGMSRERVRQIQNIALGKLRKALNEDPLVA